MDIMVAVGDWTDKFTRQNNLLKPNTEYKLRFGSYGLKTKQIKFFRYNSAGSNFVACKVSFNEIDEKPVEKDKWGNMRACKTEMVIKTSDLKWEIPNIMCIVLQPNTIISSISLAVKDCSNNSSGKSATTKKVTAAGIPTGWSNGKKPLTLVA